MLNFIKTLSISLILSALIIPGGVSAAPTAVPTAAASGSAQLVVDNPLPVVTWPNNPSLAGAMGMSCSANEIAVSNLVQETGLINFNQSANCFTISLTQLSLQPHLALSSHASINQTVAVIPTTTVSWQSVSTNQPFVPAMPLSAIPSVALVTGLILMAVLSLKRLAKHTALHLSSSLSLSQLQVMRC